MFDMPDPAFEKWQERMIGRRVVLNKKGEGQYWFLKSKAGRIAGWSHGGASIYVVRDGHGPQAQELWHSEMWDLNEGVNYSALLRVHNGGICGSDCPYENFGEVGD